MGRCAQEEPAVARSGLAARPGTAGALRNRPRPAGGSGRARLGGGEGVQRAGPRPALRGQEGADHELLPAEPAGEEAGHSGCAPVSDQRGIHHAGQADGRGGPAQDAGLEVEGLVLDRLGHEGVALVQIEALGGEVIDAEIGIVEQLESQTADSQADVHLEVHLGTSSLQVRREGDEVAAEGHVDPLQHVDLPERRRSPCGDCRAAFRTR